MRLFLLAVLPFLCCCCDKTKNVAVENLRCEYLENPVGIDVAKPRFSWIIVTHGVRGVRQDTYRIIVSDNLSELRKKSGNCWDSGPTQSGNTVNIAYEGTALASDQTYYWRVCSYIAGRECWSKTAEFHTGMFNPAEWKAKWISTDEDIANESPQFRKQFEIEKPIKTAHVYASSAGFYELYLNGEKIGADVLNPVVTDYRKTVLYSVYDVTERLKKGSNAFGVLLGNGAYNMRQIEGRFSWAGAPLGKPRFLLQMKVLFTDGSEQLVTSGEDWQYTSSPITYNNLHGGEDYDARKEISGWANVGLDGQAWKNAVAVDGPGGKLQWQTVPVRVQETIVSVVHITPAKGVYLFDLGQNIAGWWHIEVQGSPGQTIRVRGAETLNDELFPKNLEDGDRMSTKFAHHAQVWTDYTLKSSKKEVYEPHFFYTGFRYVEVATHDSVELTGLKVEGRVVKSDISAGGEWVSSNELLNKIHHAGVWSQKGNHVFYPTDCPHREKGAYGGDGQAVAEASMHDFQMATFYMKWLNDMRDAQEPDGKIPNTAPTLVGGMGGGIGFGSAYFLIPWWMHHYYNDQRILEEHYPNMKMYMGHLNRLARTDSNPQEPYIINFFDGYWYCLGEWQDPRGADCPYHDVVSTFYYYYDALVLSKIAETLGHSEDAHRYEALSDTIKEAFNGKFFNPETLLVGLDSTYQAYQLLALQGGIMPDKFHEGMIKTVVEDIKKRDNHLNTGIFGSKYLWSELSNAGYHDLAYTVATQETFPSYGWWIRNNSTTLLEQWNAQNSHNHEMFGSITEYFYKYLAGIRSPMEDGTSVGYRHIRLEPCMPEGLDMVKASIQTVSGKVVSGWKKKDGQFLYDVTIPANTSATVVLAAEMFKQSAQVTESHKLVWQNGSFLKGSPGIVDIRQENGQLIITLESGKYSFEILQTNNEIQ
jgi:alpha-L-rhamnosidase